MDTGLVIFRHRSGVSLISFVFIQGWPVFFCEDGDWSNQPSDIWLIGLFNIIDQHPDWEKIV
jgi:hypothetical protein